MFKPGSHLRGDTAEAHQENIAKIQAYLATIEATAAAFPRGLPNLSQFHTPW